MKKAAPVSCPQCGEPATIAQRTVRFRRGSRVLAVEVRLSVCTGSCRGPDGQMPFQFADPNLMKAADEAAQTAWMAHYGEPMPPSERLGRRRRE